ncbi:hypothetical protein DSOL_4259 [Desulfosporosinus metallidurans]|uniref:Uncharacterized protein n=1 Tax=Desulfosporosinus metallidurans TaxID=1888891 RepID=A0A1Q8QL24_9FIRM|nr:hypothetical protein DSOL_4259 [Desulfosporosinus metallidurans]
MVIISSEYISSHINVNSAANLVSILNQKGLLIALLACFYTSKGYGVD